MSSNHMTEMEILLKFVPGQIIGHRLFNVASRWRITMLSPYSGRTYRNYRIHALPVRLNSGDRESTRRCTTCGQDGCSVFTQLDKVTLYDEEGNTYDVP
jgi:hypothetical protein